MQVRLLLLVTDVNVRDQGKEPILHKSTQRVRRLLAICEGGQNEAKTVNVHTNDVVADGTSDYFSNRHGVSVDDLSVMTAEEIEALDSTVVERKVWCNSCSFTSR